MGISIDSGPSWADALTAFSTAVLALLTAGLVVVTAALAVAAVWAGKIAINQLKLMETTERHKRTFDLIRAYTTPGAAIEPGTNRTILISPMQAHALLDSLGEELPSAAGDAARVKQIVGAIMLNYIVLRNHLDEVDDLYSRGMIDREFYLGRQLTVIKDGVKMLRTRAEFSQTSTEDAAFLARLDKVARDYESKNNTSPV